MTSKSNSPTEFAILRVGDLRRMIEGLDDATWVAVHDDNVGWRNVASVARPDEDAYVALSLELGTAFDVRDTDTLAAPEVQVGNPTEFSFLRVGDLRRMLRGLHGATHVLVWDEEMDAWRNVASVALPDDDCDEYVALSFFMGDRMDTRQF